MQAIEKICDTLLSYSKTVEPPFHLFHDQGKILFQLTNGEGKVLDAERPFTGFVIWHKIGTEWPQAGRAEFPIPPTIWRDGNVAITGFEVPADAAEDFDWEPLVLEAIQRLKNETPIN